MPVAFTHDRGDEDKYLIIVGKTAVQLDTRKQRYITVCLRGKFSEVEASKFALAAFDEMDLVPCAAQFFQQAVKVETLAFSVGGKVPEVLQYIISNYSIPEYIDCYEWHVMMYYLREYLSPSF